MKKFIATVLLLCLVSTLMVSCDLYKTQLAPPPFPIDTVELPQNRQETTASPDKGQYTIPDGHVFVSDCGHVCINHYYANTSKYAMITTPAVYYGDTAEFENDVRVWSELSGSHIIMLIYERTPENTDITERRAMVYTTKDMGESWSASELDYTPTTTSLKYPITNMSLIMTDDIPDATGSIVLGTNRCEVFFYVTEDGGETWEKRRNFKLLNYRNEAMHTGGLLYEDLGFISFIARDGKNPNVYMTRDGGYTWALMDIPTPDGYTDDGAYVDTIWKWNGCVTLETVFGDERRRYVSDDNGQTWEWEP